jgi:hypothetical protein
VCHLLLFGAANPPLCGFSSEHRSTLRYPTGTSLNVFLCELRSLRPADAGIFLFVCLTCSEQLEGKSRAARANECTRSPPKLKRGTSRVVTSRQNAQVHKCKCAINKLGGGGAKLTTGNFILLRSHI